MSRDFTIEIFKKLLNELIQKEYKFIPFKNYSKYKNDKIIILRHDVDKLPLRSLKFAEIENKFGIKGTYYFRIVKQSFDTTIIKKIISLGHEIGYHYEDLSIAKGDYEKALKLFEEHLAEFRKLYDVKTICMHGSPLSKWDNKKLWEKYSYKDEGIIAEPYFDLDKEKVFYITDTGRMWDGGNVSVRDKMTGNFKSRYRSTQDIIDSVKDNSFPVQVMFTFHPQRWSDGIINWSGELLKQKSKNVIKKVIVKRSK